MAELGYARRVGENSDVPGSSPPSCETPVFPRMPPSKTERTTPSKTADLPRVYEEVEGTETDQTALVAPTSVKQGQHPTLLVIGGTASGNAFRLEKPKTIIGRARHADVCLADVGVSRIHCAVYYSAEGGASVEDHGSRNGTIVNGRNVTGRVKLLPGDRIGIGPEAVLQYDVLDSAQQDLAKRMYENATRDPLTRAFNRLHFTERFATELAYAVRHAEALGVLLVDVDHFKRVNDTYGHLTGDYVLRELASMANRMLRTEDIFARYGGEEFVVVARGLGAGELAGLGERLCREAARLPLNGVGGPIHITISVGAAALDEVAGSERPGEALLALADKRLYAAKLGGRNRVVAGG